MTRKCDICNKEYNPDPRNLKRGWGLTCSKKCAAKKREQGKPGYDPARVAYNNERRRNWNAPDDDNWFFRDSRAMDHDDIHPFSEDAFN